MTPQEYEEHCKNTYKIIKAELDFMALLQSLGNITQAQAKLLCYFFKARDLLNYNPDVGQYTPKEKGLLARDIIEYLAARESEPASVA